MKRFLITLLLMAIIMVSNAQTNHMKFKGVPMEGPVNSFVQKLRAKSYTYIGSDKGVATLKDEFAGTKDCINAVARYANKDEVNVVGVLLPAEETWSAVYNQYSTFKGLLTEKYGEPECAEEFSVGILPSSDYLRFHRILDGECHYVAEFLTENGKVQVTMVKSDTLKASVLIRYIDKANLEDMRKKIMENL